MHDVSVKCSSKIDVVDRFTSYSDVCSTHIFIDTLWCPASRLSDEYIKFTIYDKEYNGNTMWKTYTLYLIGFEACSCIHCAICIVIMVSVINCVCVDSTLWSLHAIFWNMNLFSFYTFIARMYFSQGNLHMVTITKIWNCGTHTTKWNFDARILKKTLYFIQNKSWKLNIVK